MMTVVDVVKSWIYEAASVIKLALETEEISIDTKNDRTDLVTNIDRQTQNFLIEKIKTFDPEAKILAEENGMNQLSDMSGRVYVIDPIDGTMNFVLEKENFCIMLGIYEDGVAKLGFIYDVIRDRFLWGGPDMGVFCNDEKVEQPKDKELSEGLVGTNAGMYAANFKGVRKICNFALGTRVTGCAGIELIAVLLGKRVAYLSNLSPWDYAAGGVLLETFGFKMSNFAGEKLAFDGREYFIASTPKAYDEIQKIIKESKN